MDETDSDEDEEWFKPVEVTASDAFKAVSKQNTGNHSRVILHIDIDCFYAQVEMLRNPQLRNKPLGIQQKYIIVTCNYVARERGLTKLMTLKDAREKCPDLILVNDYLQKYCPLVERLGFDENFLDITDLVNERINSGTMQCPSEVKGHVYLSENSRHGTCTCGCWARLVTGSHIAAEIRAGLQKELGITCCGGIAHNKLLSKLVAGTHKPNQQTTLFPDNVKALMSGQTSVRSIQGIGHTTARRLKELGVVTVEDLQNVELSVLEEEFGQMSADTMKKLCVGIDDSPVIAFGLPQTLSDEDSFKKCSDLQDVKARIRQLVNSLLHRLLEDGRRPQTLRLTIRRMSETNRYNNRESRQCTIPSILFNKFSSDNLAHTQSQLEVLAYSLFTKMVDTRSPFHLTLINVAFAKLDQKSSNDISNFFSPRGTQQQYSKKTDNSTDGNCNISPEQHEGKSELDKNAEKIDSTRCTTSRGKAKSPGKTSVSGIQKWLVKQTDHVKERKDESAHQRLDTDFRIEDKQRVNESVSNKAAKRHSNDSSFDMDREKFKKRSRVDTTAGNQAGSVADLLPADFDFNVFLELPPNIQKEVLENAAAHRDNSAVSKETASNISSEKGALSRNFTRSGYQSTAACTLANTDSSQTTNACFGETDNYAGGVKAEVKNTFSDLHAEKLALDRKQIVSHMKPPLTDKKHIKVQTSVASNMVLNKQVTGHSKVDRQVAGQSKVDRQDAGQSKVDGQVSAQSEQSFSETFSLPPDIDETVFSSLPPLVQQELIQQWKCEKDGKIKSTGIVKSPDKQFFKSPKPSTSSSITDYFPKKS